MQIISVEALAELDYLTADILLGKTSSQPVRVNVLIFRYADSIHAYINRCLHMHKALNHNDGDIFDNGGRQLRCSVHGFIYDPETGVCQSPVCRGQVLQPINVVEENGMLVLKHKQAQLLAVHRHSSLGQMVR